ncbi:hypothetical protein DM872_00305 [Pseudomonas taiwanensis]|uniref:hypothetical protein n=1 Tax=Pseudomonas taiwanensis TaxID=470150 RepID=UPI0015BB1B1B|nr:hypothetical protein [Pseudomonas taiwanensis]NWL75302.1 hypothetical protein [Pseudomonas taiwanensis]
MKTTISPWTGRRSHAASSLALMASLLAGCVPVPPPSGYTQVVPPADFSIRFNADPAVWGAYASLVGHRFTPQQQDVPGYDISWSTPGQEIRETARSHAGDVLFSRTIRRGARPGQLISNLNGVEWVGTLEADGSVLFLGIAPYRIRQSPDGAYVHEIVEASADGKVTKVLFSTPYPQENAPTQTIAQTAPPAPATQQPTAEQAALSPAVTATGQSAPSAEHVHSALTATTAVVESAPSVSAEPQDNPPSASPDSAAQDAQVEALMAQHKAMIQEAGIEEEVNAQAAEILAQIERENAASQPAPASTEASAPAANGLLTKTVNGVGYNVSPSLPAPITGTYEYEGNGEPVVRIHDGDMASAFQPHGDPEIPITAWIAKAPDGSDLKEDGVNGRYQLMLVIQYGAGGGGNYPEGSYSLLPVVVAPDLGKAFILGERVKNSLD